MKIVANRILTRWEIEQQRVHSDSWIKMELSQSIGNKLAEIKPLYSQQTIEGNVEYRIEAYIFSRDVFMAIMSQLRGLLTEKEYERIRNIIIEDI